MTQRLTLSFSVGVFLAGLVLAAPLSKMTGCNAHAGPTRLTDKLRSNHDGPTCPDCGHCRAIRGYSPCAQLLGPLDDACGQTVGGSQFLPCAEAVAELHGIGTPTRFVIPAMDTIEACRQNDVDECRATFRACVIANDLEEESRYCTWSDTRAQGDDWCRDYERCLDFLEDRGHALQWVENACGYLYRDRPTCL